MKISAFKFNRLVLLVVAFFLSLLLFLNSSNILGDRGTITIAIAGPTGGESASGVEMVQGAQLYVDKLNQSGGIKGKKVELLVFDDSNDANTAKENATEIIDTTEALAVLGHLYSSTSTAAGKLYQQAGIPAISATATADEVTQSNYWYFRVIFNNRLQASFIANYAEKVLNYDRASIIYSDDSYGETLKTSFTKTFTKLGGEVKNQWAIDIDADNFERQKKQIIADLLAAKNEHPGIIFCATHNSDVVDLIVQMKRQGLNYPIIGADSLGNTAFAQKFQKYSEEKAEPGYFTDDIYAVSPIIFDVANEKAQQFRNEYIKKYQQQPSWTAANYYDAASMAATAIKKAKINNNLNLQQQREKVRNVLATINNTDNSIEGLTGNLYFDRLGNFNESIYIGTFSRQKFISAFTQLQPINNIKAIGNLDRALDSEEVLLVDGKYRHKTNIVYTGIDINEIRNLDEKTSSYLVDFYLWFRYRGDIDADNIEFTNYGTDRMDSGDKLELDDPIEESKIGDIKYRVYRVKADFKEKFRFDDYPFDRQQLAVRFRHKNLTRDNLIYVIDEVGMRDTVADEVIANWQESNVFETISDWKVTEVDFFPDVLVNDSTLGNPKFFDSDTDLEYSRFNTVIKIKRDIVSFSIKNLLPLLFFVCVSYLLLFLPFDSISIEAVSGTLLAIVFFHLSLLDTLPEGIGYVVALDYAFYVIYALIGLELLLVVVGNKPEIKNNKLAINRLITASRIIFPAILVISAIALLVNYEVFS